MLHPDGSVFQRPVGPGSCSSATFCTGYTQEDEVGSSDIAALSGDNELYVLHADGSVFEHPISPGSCFPATSCSGFDQVDQVGSSDRALAANAGYLYVLHADGSVFQRFASAGSCSSITSCTGYSEIDQVGSTDGALATTHPGAQGPACDAGDLNVSGLLPGCGRNWLLHVRSSQPWRCAVPGGWVLWGVHLRRQRPAARGLGSEGTRHG